MFADPFDLRRYDVPVGELRHGEFFLGSQCPGIGQDVFAYEIMLGDACHYFSGRSTGFDDLKGSKNDIRWGISAFLYGKCLQLRNRPVVWRVARNPTGCQGGSIPDAPVEVIAQDCRGLHRIVHIRIPVVTVAFQLLVMFIELIIRQSGWEKCKDQGSAAFLVFFEHIFFRTAFRIRRHLVTARRKFPVCPVVDCYMQLARFARIFRNRKVVALASDCTQFLRRLCACW